MIGVIVSWRRGEFLSSKFERVWVAYLFGYPEVSYSLSIPLEIQQRSLVSPLNVLSVFPQKQMHSIWKKQMELWNRSK